MCILFFGVFRVDNRFSTAQIVRVRVKEPALIKLIICRLIIKFTALFFYVTTIVDILI